jgi:hypothetical protein
MGQFESKQIALTTEATEITEKIQHLALGVLGGWRQRDPLPQLQDCR